MLLINFKLTTICLTMNNPSLAKAALFTLILVITAGICFELYVRNKGFDTSYDDDPSLWADKRSMVYEPAEKTTVFIGSSRIKFDLDIAAWQKITGTHAVMLACVGSSPLPVLNHLAADKNFKGNLIIDVTEVLFFSGLPMAVKTPNENIEYYEERTPAQRAGFYLNHFLESKLAFLDKDRLSLNATLDKLQIPNRSGVFEFPLFPPDFGRVMFNRQEYMTAKFLADTNQQKQVKNVWTFLGKINKAPPVSGAPLDSIFHSVKIAVDKIKVRGGKVLFVRTPSSGPFLMGENMGYPHAKYWDKLLEATNCKGIHFADYPVINHFECPEFSHLSQPDAWLFTKEFIRILLEEKDWSFSAQTATVKK